MVLSTQPATENGKAAGGSYREEGEHGVPDVVKVAEGARPPTLNLRS